MTIQAEKSGGNMSYTRVPYTEEQKRRDEEHLKDVKFYNENHQQLLAQYPEQWIGILGQQVISTAPSESELITQLNEMGFAWDWVFRRHLTEKEEILITRLWDPDYV